MADELQQGRVEADVAVFSTLALASSVHPEIVKRAIYDPALLNRERVYVEAISQTRPLAAPGAESGCIAEMIRDGTARSSGLSSATAERMATSARTLDSFICGSNPCGKTAEVVAVADYRDLHRGGDVRIVNPPERIADNLHDIRLAPDCASRKDLVFAFEAKNGEVIWKYNGQVKTGGAQYVADTLVKMAETPGYGKVGYVDARYVNSDGTPRVAPDAFTPSQAAKLQRSKVRLRGIPDLENRSRTLMEDIRLGKLDGLNPITREELRRLRDDIAASYRPRSVFGRIGGGAALAAASAAVVSVVLQLATDGKIDAKTLGRSALTGAIFGASGVAADLGLYHLGSELIGMAPEAAKEFAKQGVAAGFCILAVGTDLLSEVSASRRGDTTIAGAVAGSAAKAALDILPLVTAALGLVGLPLLVVFQVGGRWLIGRAKEADRVLEGAIAEDIAFASDMTRWMASFDDLFAKARSDCANTDAVFAEIIGNDTPQSLRIVND